MSNKLSPSGHSHAGTPTASALETSTTHISYPSANSAATSSNFLTLKNDINAPILLAHEVRNAKVETESEEILNQRAKYIKEQLDQMTEEQLTRFEFFVRSHFPKNRVKEIMNEALGPKQLVTDEMIIVVSGLAKLFVGEVCDLAAEVMNEREEKDGISPDHIQEAYRRMQNEGKIGHRPDHHYFLNSDSMLSFKEFPFDSGDAYLQAVLESKKKNQNQNGNSEKQMISGEESRHSDQDYFLEEDDVVAEQGIHEEEEEASTRKKARRA